MQAVIMAGGKGTRLASILKDIPKPMVKIEGKPLLEYQINNLKECGVDRIIIITGHLSGVIQEYFRDGADFDVHISYYIEESPLGTAGALSKISDLLEDTFFLVFGDLFINIDFNRFFDFHKNTQALITLYSHPNSHPYDSDIIITDDEYRVIDWNNKSNRRVDDYKNLVNAGLYVVDKNAISMIALIQSLKGQDNVDLEKELLIPLIPVSKIYAYQSTEYVKDIGTPERLRKVTMDYINGVCKQRNLHHKQKCIFLDRDGTINKYVGFLKTASQIELEPRAADAIRLINESEYLAIVITNQPVIARGECSYEEFDRINKRLYTLLGNEGAYIDGMYYCPHHPDNGFEGEIPELKIDCECRKPKIGMLKKAEVSFDADLSNSWFIGDTTIDVQTGINAGMHTAMLRSGASRKNIYDVAPEIIADDLYDAVKKIIQTSRTGIMA